MRIVDPRFFFCGKLYRIFPFRRRSRTDIEKYSGYSDQSGKANRNNNDLTKNHYYLLVGKYRHRKKLARR
jgi:hypothetical protein